MVDSESTLSLPPLIQQWVDTYNANDLEGHVALYTDTASIVIPGPGSGSVDLNPDGTKSVFREMEHALDSAAPNRRVRVDWCAVDGDKVCIEATLQLDAESPVQPLSIHFTLNSDGNKIVRDRTYVHSSLLAGLGS